MLPPRAPAPLLTLGPTFYQDKVEDTIEKQPVARALAKVIEALCLLSNPALKPAPKAKGAKSKCIWKSAIVL